MYRRKHRMIVFFFLLKETPEKAVIQNSDTQRGFMSTIAGDYNRQHSVNRRRSTEAYRRVMSTWPSMMVGTAEGDLPKLFSPALLA